MIEIGIAIKSGQGVATTKTAKNLVALLVKKKVRSDVINAINDKYVFITQGEINLIGSVRKEEDKRFFEYFVVPTEVKTVQKMIEKK
jgi:hypothetical protein